VSKQKKIKIGLALSGGGYRAAAYHIGTLRKLKELGILDRITMISTISGGSIVGASFGLNGDNYSDFEKNFIKGLKKSVIRKVIWSWRILPVLILICSALFAALFYFPFTALSWLTPAIIIPLFILLGYFQFSLLPISRAIEDAYDDIFFNKKTLKDLTSKKRIAINATNAETSRPFTFSKERMTDSTYEYSDPKIRFKQHDFPISRAVAASSCVPFAFTPIRIAKHFFENEKDYNLVQPRLIDGGVYDNQGVHKLTFPTSAFYTDIVIVSNAGDDFPFKHKFFNVISLLVRTSNIFMNRIKNLQMIDHLYDGDQKQEVAYLSLGWELDKSLEEFVKSLGKGKIKQTVYEAHHITAEQVADLMKKVRSKKNCDNETAEITKLLKKSVNYAQLIVGKNTAAQNKMARGVGTNLTALSDAEIKNLINHAYVMTELQVRMYCPSLFMEQ